MIKTKEELKLQAEKIGLEKWTVHTCSMCGYPCGYLIKGEEVFYDSGCFCVGRVDIEKRSWDDLAKTYNMNQPERNPKISQEYLDELEKVWQFNSSSSEK